MSVVHWPSQWTTFTIRFRSVLQVGLAVALDRDSVPTERKRVMSSSTTPATPDSSERFTSSSAQSLRARIQTAIAVWRRRLLDLTKRNRALNFKPNKVSTVTIVDEQPVEVFRFLCEQGRAMRFRPTLPSVVKGAKGNDEASVGADSNEALSNDEHDAPQPMELDFAPYDADSLDERHTDDVLQSLATPEALDKSLRRLDEQARATIEEQGVNVLFLALGMLHYTESADSTDVLRAPLIMVPVSLTRKSARTGYTLEATDDEPLVNPALIEYLRRSFAVELPAIPTLGENDSPNLQDFYRGVGDIAAERVRSGMSGWSVKTDIFLGLFSFQKLVMFKDLEVNADAFTSHHMITQLITRETTTDGAVMGLPQDVRAMDLDGEFAPERTAQVVDADSSQLRAIAAVSKGHALVLEGPPGTGKSQTITNLIAQALSEGKSVLFVAEKMAALQVVHSRLVSAGLGEFCLELHASKANKRAVMQELRAAIDASLQRPAIDRTTQRLPSVRGGLSEYAKAVHAPAGALGISPFAACGMLDEVLDAPRFTTQARLDGITRELLADTERQLGELAATAEQIAPVSTHPWRHTGRTFYTPRLLDELRTSIDALAARFERVVQLAEAVQRELALPPVQSLDDVQTAVTIARLFHESPGAPLAVLQSDAWNTPPTEATSRIETGRRLSRWRQTIDAQFTESVFDQEHSADIAYVETKASGLLGFLAVLDGRFRAIKRRWLSYRKPGYAPGVIEQAAHLRQVDLYLEGRAALASDADSARALFGNLWQGEQSDWDALERYVDWVVRVREACVRHGLSTESLSVATKREPDISRAIELEAAIRELASPLAELHSTVDWPADYLERLSLVAIVERLRTMSASTASAPAWATFEQIRQQVAKSPASELLDLAISHAATPHEMPFGALARMFRRAVLERFLEDVVGARPALRDFRALAHEQRIAEFRQLDERVLMENRAAVVAKLRETTQQRLQEPASRAGLPFIQREMAKQRNVAPLRRTLQHAEATVRAIKPCFLMSPLTVAQYLDGKVPSFDLVIFDEASQLPPEDAVGAIARGRQLVVVGDPKQLPPTDFFTISGTADAPLGDDGLPVVEDAESVLEEYMGAGVPVTRLKWHYRSAHESLITFSNVSFYDADLYTFPSVETHSDASGLSFEYVADGVYEGKGLNLTEARRVVDAVVRHAKERPQESLGVGTFNMRQQLAVLDELELRRREDPSIEPFFSRSAAEPFFVKNLENIQGDERDVIFLSVTYAKGPDGRLRYNFGPINGENGWRRLNVLTTRARKQMRVFSSIRGEDINAAATTSRGALLLRDFLRFAEFGTLESVIANASAATESPFERQLAAELTRRGVRVVPQVGVAGYRIDIGVLDDEVPGRFVCGIECDGVAYHGAETARDRDRLRQQVLEARGWTILRVWSTDWFKDRSGQIERLLALIARAKDESKERVRAKHLAEAHAKEVETERPAPTQTAAAPGPYVRPTAAPYRFAGGQGRYAGQEFLETPASFVEAAIIDVVQVEAPVHVDDLSARLAAMWGLGRVGSRIAAKIHEALERAVLRGGVVLRGDFVWTPALAKNGATIPVRSRAGTRISGDRVPIEEVRAALVLVLRAAGGMSAEDLMTEVRQVLGVGKSALAPAFDGALLASIKDGVVGEGSVGFALRG